ncbi:MAG: virulence RhuM family protein [Cardiobacteriaceae bacterium]|nr:virulence RhuM family protein [Cardiobacteriaceae bacterium]
MSDTEFILFSTDDNKISIDVRFEDETVWLSLNQLVELFQSSKSNISEHIKNIFAEEELDEISTVRNFRTVQMEGNRQVSRQVAYYNLDMIISLGYRVHSKMAVKFRKINFLHTVEKIFSNKNIPLPSFPSTLSIFSHYSLV